MYVNITLVSILYKITADVYTRPTTETQSTCREDTLDLSYCNSGVGTTGATGAGAPVKFSTGENKGVPSYGCTCTHAIATHPST